MSDAAPPAKRPATEKSRCGAAAPALSARERFLRELERYASDDDGDGGSGGADTAAVAARVAPRPAPAHADFFFGDGDDAIAADDDAHEPPRTTARGQDGTGASASGGHDGSSDAAPLRVGLQLLHRMHTLGGVGAERAPPASQPPHDRSARSTSTPTSAQQQQSSSGSFEVVQAYVPLSTGGFLSTAGAAGDTMEGHQVRVGDVLALRKPPGTAASPPPPPPPHTNRSASTTPSSSPTTATAPASAAAVEVLAQRAMGHFKSAAAFTSDEVKYGRSLTPEMTRVLFEVARVDQHSRSVEAVFLDGARAKLSYLEVRPAGYVERKMYAAWKADPASRPVATIHSAAASPTTSSSPTATAAPSQPPSPPPPAAAWWVTPRLLVRLAAESAGDWYGKRCAVTSVQRSGNRIRLTEVLEEAADGDGGTAVAETRELVGLDGLETVIPRKGGRAMVVLGARRGEMCTVRNRVRGPDGELIAVEVEVGRTKEVLAMRPEELCALCPTATASPAAAARRA
ncbi:hypothetical protein NESM_000332500 [Novymonas esmeraldas]|uniref:Uncharacterized protein n=1 Tax=Novymonas esmeraldas TaxID=1808958 RepID=A0AAW0EM05_9TRYP